MDSKQHSRRRFLKEGAALAGLAVGAGAMRSASGQPLDPPPPDETDFALPYGVRSPFETSVRVSEKTIPTLLVVESLTPHQDSVGIITPSPLHFMVIRWHKAPPRIDPQQHRLLIHGLVDRPLIFTMEELKRLPSVSRIHFLECGGNTAPYEHPDAQTIQETHGKTSCSEWTGVLLSELLREAGVQKGASWIVAESADAGKHSQSIPLEKAMDDCIVAYGQNGEAVRPEQGYPIRLLAPGFIGVYNVKFLRRIKVVDQPYMNRDESALYPILRPSLKGKALWFNFEWGPKSVITRPSAGQRLGSPGFYEITGLAWSGSGAVRRVEVSTDGGRTWKEAKLEGPAHPKAHTRFRFPWTWDGGEAVLQSRSTDDQGNAQPSLAEFSKLVGVEPGFFRTAKSHINLFNAVQPWKVAKDGSVQNAMFS